MLGGARSQQSSAALYSRQNPGSRRVRWRRSALGSDLVIASGTPDHQAKQGHVIGLLGRTDKAGDILMHRSALFPSETFEKAVIDKDHHLLAIGDDDWGTYVLLLFIEA
jgi:hypothetical protein